MARPKAETTTAGTGDGPVPRLTKKQARPRLPIEVLERRLQNPFGDGSVPIIFKDDGWRAYIADGNRTGRVHDLVHRQGYAYVTPEDLAGKPEDYGFDTQEGRVVRGERGREVLLKIPADDFQMIALAKDARNRGKASPGAIKAFIAEQAGAQFGDEAGAFLSRNVELTEHRAPEPLEELG